MKKFSPQRVFIYSSDKDNCQRFLNDCLSASGLMTPEIGKFILQDANRIYEGLGWLKDINRRITDAAAQLDVVQNGGSEKGLKRKVG